MAELGEDRPMTWGEGQQMWKEVYRIESERFKAERDQARATAERLAVGVAAYRQAIGGDTDGD